MRRPWEQIDQGDQGRYGSSPPADAGEADPTYPETYCSMSHGKTAASEAEQSCSPSDRRAAGDFCPHASLRKASE